MKNIINTAENYWIFRMRLETYLINYWRRMSKKDSQLEKQTSPAIPDLTRLQLIHTKGSTPSNIKIYISTDNSAWTDITSSEICSSSDIDVPMPAKGNYYVKVVNKSSAAIDFLSFRYTYEPCHCLRVVSE